MNIFLNRGFLTLIPFIRAIHRGIHTVELEYPQLIFLNAPRPSQSRLSLAK